MKTAPFRILIAACALALAVASAYAQDIGGQGSSEGLGGHGMGAGRHHGKLDKAAPAKPKVDEKAYNAALKSLPDKPSDPWHNVR